VSATATGSATRTALVQVPSDRVLAGVIAGAQDAESLERFRTQGENCGWCSRPIRLVGSQTTVDQSTGEIVRSYSTASEPDGVLLKACGKRRATQCPSCAATYGADARMLVRSGLSGGKGIPTTVSGHPMVFATFTAPSFGAVHGARSGSNHPCRPGVRGHRCAHGRLIACWVRHDPDDPTLGEPLCPDCYDYERAVLWNALCLGQVHFRGTWTDAGHPALVEQSLFDAVQAILVERGEDNSKRASASSDYLLTGLVVCSDCGRHFTGTRATGRSATYRYYTCSGRQRYGTAACDADRLPAEALDDAVVAALLAAYEDSELFTRAVEQAQEKALSDRSRHDGELRAIDAELTKVEGGIDRYLRAFETGAMPEAIFGERVKALATQATALRARH
jgi:hypothetical protein